MINCAVQILNILLSMLLMFNNLSFGKTAIKDVAAGGLVVVFGL